MGTRATVESGPTSMFELEALESLPCGCIASAHRARLLDVLIVSLEVKGPYCTLPGHVTGQTLRLGDLVEEEGEAGGEFYEHRP